MFSKKINLSLLLLTLAAGVQAQKTIVQGTIDGLNDPIQLFYSGGIVKTATVDVKNGKFTWKAKLSEPQKVMILFPKGRVSFYAGKGKIRITGHADSLQQLRISGSPLQKEADAYFASIKGLTDEQAAIDQRSRTLRVQNKAANKEEQKKLEEKWKRLQLQKTEKLTQYVKAHPKSYLNASLIAEMPGEYRDLKPLYDLLHPSIQQSAAGKRLSKRLDESQRIGLNATMLNFTQNGVDGKPVRFSDFKGKYVYVDVWASWCKPCRAANPNVLAAYDRYKDKNFTVIGVSLDDNEDDWKKAIQEDKLPWTQVSDFKGMKNEVAVYYGITGIPYTMLVGPDGKIIAKELHGKALHEKLAELLDK